MPPFVTVLGAAMPGIIEQFDKMRRVTKVKTSVKPDGDILSVQFLLLQAIMSEGIEVMEAEPQCMMLQYTDTKNLSLEDVHGSSSKNLNGQIALRSPTKMSVVSSPGWNLNSDLGILRIVEMLNSLWLDNLEKITENCKMTEVLPGLLELKRALYDYTILIDKILMLKTRPDLSCGNKDVALPYVSAVKESTAKLKTIINSLNPRDLKTVFFNEIVLTEDDILCAFLGLNDGVAKYLKSLPEEHRNHEPVEYYIKSYIEEKVDYLEDSMKGNISDCAVECGFTKVRAQTFADWLDTCPLKNHQPLSLWLDRYIDDMFKYSVHLTGNMPRFHFQVIPNQLVKVEAERYEEDEEGYPTPMKFSVPVINYTSGQSNWQSSEIPQNPVFWFHGTDHMSAVSIIVEGIDPRKGRATQDFSDDDGFYVSSDFAEAKDMASVWSRPAVVVFEINIDTEKFQVLDMRSLGETQWAQIVKFNRSGRSRKFQPMMALRQRFEECDGILGPSSSDGSNRTREMPGFEAWQPAGFANPTPQLCIRSEDMAKEFGRPSNIKEVIFY